MNILQVCNKSPYPPHDGGSLASYSLMRSLGRLGHQVTLLAMCTPKHGLSDDERAVLSSMVRLFTVDVDTTVSLPRLLVNLLFSTKPYNAERFISADFAGELSNILKSAAFDIVQLEGLYLMPYVPAIRLNSQAKIVLRAHNVEQEIWQRIAATSENPVKKFYFNLLYRRIKQFESAAIDEYDLLVPITERDRMEFNRMGNTKPAFVCPAALELQDDAKMKPVPASPSVFFLGSLDWKPNQEGIMWFIQEVFPQLRHRHQTLTFHIAGRNAPRWLQKRLSADGIAFHGEIPDAQQFIKSHDILVAPCFSGGGMRVKIIEAMALGIPVLTTPIGAEGLNAVNEEHILITDSAREFADYLDRLLKFPDFYGKIGENAMSFIRQHFNNMKISAELAEFYKSHLT
jgi:polysaccharide biosynthesis protein PslH